MTCRTRDPDHLRLINESAELRRIRRHLAAFEDRSSAGTDIRSLLTSIKEEAVNDGNQALARACWCLESVDEIQSRYVQAFSELKLNEFHSGWCTFELCETLLGFLESHYEESGNRFGLAFIRGQVERFQALFPYKIFVSPAFLVREPRCGICDKRFTPRGHCEHRVGEIYDGVLCTRKLTKLELLEVSMVTNPVQKYSVLFPEGGSSNDHYDYSLPRYVVDGLTSPWHGWDYRWTKIRHPHDRFADVGRNDPCPCESGLKYKRCCLGHSGVLQPHCEIIFDRPLPPGLPTLVYPQGRMR